MQKNFASIRCAHLYQRPRTGSLRLPSTIHSYYDPSSQLYSTLQERVTSESYEGSGATQSPSQMSRRPRCSQYRHAQEQYPRIKRQENAIDFPMIKQKYSGLGREHTSQDKISVRGRWQDAMSVKVATTYTLKEEFGPFVQEGPNLRSLICFRTVAFRRRRPIANRLCLIMKRSSIRN